MGWRTARFLGWALGIVLLAFSAVALLFAPTTDRPPEVDCGAPAVAILVGVEVGHGVSARADECRAAARDMFVAAMVSGGLGVITIAVLVHRRRRRATDSQMMESWRPDLDPFPAPRSAGAGAPRLPPWPDQGLVGDAHRIGRAGLVPAPAHLTIRSALPVAHARRALTLYRMSDGADSLRVRVDDDDHVQASIVATGASHFRGALVADGAGSSLIGVVRKRGSLAITGAFAAGAVVASIASVVLAAMAVGRGGGFGVAGVAVVFALVLGAMAWSFRWLDERAFPAQVNRLSDELADVLGAPAPHIEGHARARGVPFSASTILIGQSTIIGGRLIAAGRWRVVAMDAVVVLMAIVVIAMFHRRYETKLEGAALVRDGRRIDLRDLVAVHARGTALNLWDGVSVLTVPIELGWAESAARARRVWPETTAPKRRDREPRWSSPSMPPCSTWTSTPRRAADCIVPRRSQRRPRSVARSSRWRS